MGLEGGTPKHSRIRKRHGEWSSCLTGLAAAASALPAWVVIFDQRRRLVWANEAIKKFFGVDDARLAKMLLSGVVEGYDPCVPCEGLDTLVHLSGRATPVRLSVTVISPSRLRRGFMTVMQDKSHERFLEEEIRAIKRTLEKNVAQRTRDLIVRERDALYGQMVQGIVHNFRSPLQAVQASLQVLRHRLDDPGCGEAIDEPLEIIADGTSRLSQLVNDLLTRSRRDHSEESGPVDLNQLVINELRFLESDPFLKRQVQRELELDPELPTVNGVYASLAQTFQNLLRNALDAMWDSPVRRLTVRTFSWDGSVCLTVEDTGPGIPEEIRDRIFEPVFTTKPLTREGPHRPPSGTGLGLAICLSLITPLNGRLDVDSRPGGPTVFTLRLPVRA